MTMETALEKQAHAQVVYFSYLEAAYWKAANGSSSVGLDVIII